MTDCRLNRGCIGLELQTPQSDGHQARGEFFVKYLVVDSNQQMMNPLIQHWPWDVSFESPWYFLDKATFGVSLTYLPHSSYRSSSVTWKVFSASYFDRLLWTSEWPTWNTHYPLTSSGDTVNPRMFFCTSHLNLAARLIMSISKASLLDLVGDCLSEFKNARKWNFSHKD